jgi:hypothetical protein
MSIEIKANVIKRNGQEVPFEIDKIVNAIRKANAEVDRLHQLNEYQIVAISDKIALEIGAMPHAAGVEEIQDMVERGIMEMRGYEVAQKYVRYRYKREIARKSNTTDNGILAVDNAVENISGIEIQRSLGRKHRCLVEGNAITGSPREAAVLRFGSENAAGQNGKKRRTYHFFRIHLFLLFRNEVSYYILRLQECQRVVASSTSYLEPFPPERFFFRSFNLAEISAARAPLPS